MLCLDGNCCYDRMILAHWELFRFLQCRYSSGILGHQPAWHEPVQQNAAGLKLPVVSLSPQSNTMPLQETPIEGSTCFEKMHGILHIHADGCHLTLTACKTPATTSNDSRQLIPEFLRRGTKPAACGSERAVSAKVSLAKMHTLCHVRQVAMHIHVYILIYANSLLVHDKNPHGTKHKHAICTC